MPAPCRPARRGRVPPVRAALLVVLVSALASGCATFGSHSGQGAEGDTGVTLLVKNYNWSTIHIYVMGSGQTTSLGQLTSMNTDTFAVPRSVLASSNSIRLIADPIGSTSAYISEPVLVAPGDRVEWTIQSQLAQSSIMIR